MHHRRPDVLANRDRLHHHHPTPSAIETKPGSAGPFFCTKPSIIDPLTGNELLILKHSWPSIARRIWRDHKRYSDTDMHPYLGVFYTGEGAQRDEDGYIWTKGPIDDVINVSGHRLRTTEIECVDFALGCRGDGGDWDGG